MTLNHISTRLFSIKNILTCTAINTVLYFILKSELFLRMQSPIGDEKNFIQAFNAIKDNGFLAEWSSGNISPVFYIIAYPINLIIDNSLYSFRLISILSAIISLLLLYRFATKHLLLKGVYLYSAALFIISFFIYRLFWQGINDGLFHLLIIMSFFCVYNIHYKIKLRRNLVFLGLIIGLLIGIRIIAFLVIPGYIFFLYKKFKYVFIVGFTALIIGFSLHAPSLIQNRKLSSVDKNPSKHLSWAQKNHLSQQYIYEGKIKEGTRVTWQELENYIKINGTDSLPNTFIDSVTFNPKWTIKELFNDFWHSLRLYFKVIALGLLLLIWFTFFRLKNKLNDTFKLSYNLLLFFWSHTFFISLVVITRVEIRWYTSFIFLAILLYHQIAAFFKPLVEDSKRVLFLKLNLVLLLCFQLQFILTDSNLFSDYLREIARNTIYL